MKSRLVLGAANYGKIGQTEVDKLLGTASEYGINTIDTAHGYENSEARIGVSLKTYKEFEVNTKVGLPDPQVFTPTGIRLSVEESLKRLGLESLGTLFVHSLPAKHLTEENIAAMVSLKKEGKIKRIGYAGDGDHLGYAVEIASFDDFMATFNIIDQSNSKKLRNTLDTTKIYYKLVMAQAIWTSLEWERRFKSQKLIRILFGKPPVPESWVDYCLRFKSFKSGFDNKDFAATFLRFALFSGSAEQFVVLGTLNQQHIQEAAKVEQEDVGSALNDVTKFEDLWAKFSSATWSAHNG